MTANLLKKARSRSMSFRVEEVLIPVFASLPLTCLLQPIQLEPYPIETFVKQILC
jgi:hypothetical protein